MGGSSYGDGWIGVDIRSVVGLNENLHVSRGEHLSLGEQGVPRQFNTRTIRNLTGKQNLIVFRSCWPSPI